MKVRRDLLLAGLSGILLSLSFEPFSIWPLGFVGLVPLLVALHSRPVRTWSEVIRGSLILGLIPSYVLNLISFHWLIHTISVHGHQTLWTAVPVFLGYILLVSGRMVLFAFLVLAARKIHVTKPLPSVTLLYPVFWGLAEQLGWQLFPWYGANLADGNLIFLQAADIFGIKSLSIIWYLVNHTVWYCRFERRSWRSRTLATTTGLLLAVHAYGVYSWMLHDPQRSRKVPVAVIQGNTPLSFAATRNAREALYGAVTSMAVQTRDLLASHQGEKPSLIVWPESAVPFLSYQGSPFLQDAVNKLVTETGIPLIFNDIFRDYRYDKDYSNIRYIDRNGEATQNYFKIELLPFGEFIPLSGMFPALKDLAPEVADFSSGQEFRLFRHDDLTLMPSVCYEIILPGLSGDFFRSTGRKADMIVNLTNDTWFGESFESWQHLTLGAVRAIELRRPIVRAVNSGISTMITSRGEVTGTTKLMTRDSRVYNVPLSRENSLYAFAGDWPHIMGLSLGGLWIGFLLISRRRPAIQLSPESRED